MERIAFIMKIKSGCEEEYMLRHKKVFPELLQVFKKVGIHNYSIFIDGDNLYAYLESDNYQQARLKMKEEPYFKKWQEYMKPLMIELDTNGNISKFIKEVFYFE